MTTKEVIDAIRKIMAKHDGSEKEFCEALVDESEGWRMRLEELEEEEDHQ